MCFTGVDLVPAREWMPHWVFSTCAICRVRDPICCELNMPQAGLSCWEVALERDNEVGLAI